MFLEFLSHAISLDSGWIIELILSNIPWIFVLAVYVFIQKDGKHVFWGFIFLVGLLYVFMDFFGLLGWIMVPLVIFVPLQMAMNIFFEGTSLHKIELPIILIVFFTLCFLFTFLIG